MATKVKHPNPKPSENGHELTAAEQLAQDLIDEFGEDLEIDVSNVDLSMPDSYGTLVWANRRVILVRDASLMRYTAMANRAMNPQVAENAQKQYQTMCWELALIDKKYPKAKKESLRLMQEEAGRAIAVRDALREN